MQKIEEDIRLTKEQYDLGHILFWCYGECQTIRVFTPHRTRRKWKSTGTYFRCSVCGHEFMFKHWFGRW